MEKKQRIEFFIILPVLVLLMYCALSLAIADWWWIFNLDQYTSVFKVRVFIYLFAMTLISFAIVSIREINRTLK